MRNTNMTIATVILCFAMPSMLNAQQVESTRTHQAQTNASTTVVGSEVDKASLRRLLGEFSTLKAGFSQTITNMQGQELQTSTGELLLKKPQQLRWSVVSPEESLLVADGNTVFNVDPFVEQVTLMDQSSLTKSNPLMLLITDQESQWAQVAVVQDKLSFTIVSLMPDSPITKLVLNFSEANTLLSVVSIDRQQQQNSLIFANVEYDTGTRAADFTFKPESTWIIDDQREQATIE